MIKVKYCILGAGPAGLSLATALLRRGESSFLLLEKEAEAGGLCRSRLVDGAPLDIGGGHFLDVRNQQVLTHLFQYLPEPEWTLHERVATIRCLGTEIAHPFEANLWQLPINTRIEALECIARAGSTLGTPVPDDFETWIRWKLGDFIADHYLLPYNRKLWMRESSELGTYWMDKLPSVSFRESLRSCLEAKAHGSLPAHGRFLYPNKFGYGEVWRRMAESLKDRVLLDYTIREVDLMKRTVNDEIQCEHFISTIPWPEWPLFAKLPDKMSQAISMLRSTPIDIEYHAERLETKAHWTYVPEPAVPYHRILLRHNFLSGAKGYWTEKNASRPTADGVLVHTNTHAYPVPLHNKPELIARIHNWAERLCIRPLGRWGYWDHLNSDVVVMQALREAELLGS